jgi:hypothetical protein
MRRNPTPSPPAPMTGHRVQAPTAAAPRLDNATRRSHPQLPQIRPQWRGVRSQRGGDSECSRQHQSENAHFFYSSRTGNWTPGNNGSATTFVPCQRVDRPNRRQRVRALQGLDLPAICTVWSQLLQCAIILTMHAARLRLKNDTRKYCRNARSLRCTNRSRRSRPGGSTRGGAQIMSATQIRLLIVGLALALSACTNPYDPVQRTIGGGLIGAGSGAAIGAAAAGGHGAALGAAVGGAVGAVGGLITTPPPPRYRY